MSSSNSSSDVPKEGVSLESNQILYLISKFLKSQELFQGSSEAFSNELVRLHLTLHSFLFIFLIFICLLMYLVEK